MRISDWSSDVCSSVICEPGLISYAATKSAVRAMNKVAALEYVGQGVRVNTIVPGGMKTPMQANVTLEPVEWSQTQISKDALGEPKDIDYGGRSEEHSLGKGCVRQI